MDEVNLANSLFIDEKYEEAIDKYSESIIKNELNAKVYCNRATCYLKLKKYMEAVEDFNRSILLDSNVDLAHFRKGLAYFELEEFESAKKSFEVGLKLSQEQFPTKDTSVYLRNIRKCDAELAADEASHAVGLKSPGTIKTTATALPVPPAQPKFTPTLIVPVRYQYYQSTSTLSISVMAKNLTSDDVVVIITQDHLRVVIKYIDSSGKPKEEVVIDKDLFDVVDPVKSKFSILKPKIEITLHKIEPTNWPTLEHTGAPRLPVPAVAKPAIVESSNPNTVNKRPKAYASAKDWDQVGTEISKELDAEKPEGDEALQKLFQDIFKDADPETKMAMKKSFQTSGGTVLSTNWKEVKEKNYEEERQAPKGMEWRNWEGQKLKQVDD
eukprot:gene4214-5989_t